METHIKIVGLLNVLYNLVGVLVGLLVLAIGVTGGSVVGLAAGANQGAATGAGLGGVLVAFGVLIGVLCLIPFLPGFVGGLALFGYKNWARILVIVLSAFNLLVFPVGTLIGAYSLWVLLHKDSAAIFANPQVDPKPIY